MGNKFIYSITLFILTFFSFAKCFSSDILLSSGKHWKVFRSVKNDIDICYIVSEPELFSGTFTRRGDPYIAISTINAKEFLFICTSGYSYHYSKTPVLEINVKDDITKFKTTFSKDSKSDCVISNQLKVKKIINQFKEGKTAVLKGISHKDTNSQDTYSLSGFTVAFEQMMLACKNNDIK